MADFFQNGSIATLHRLGDRPVEQLEAELLEWSAQRSMALVIPCLASEIDGDALPRVVDEIARIPYLSDVVIGLDFADERQFERAREFFAVLPQRHSIIWNDGPELQQIHAELHREGLAPADTGKGRNVWYCLGYYLSIGTTGAVALHDADILTYDRSMVTRLLYPVMHPTFGYAFCKGFYYRASEGRLNGRVSRLLVTPLIRALRQTVGPDDYLGYIDSFRYPLAGECAMHTSVVRSLRIPSDWGLEIGLLSEVYRRYTTERICQVDIADVYDHKHQPLSADDPSTGLHKMAIDIAMAVFRKLAARGVSFSDGMFHSIEASYFRTALELIDRYDNDAVLNGFTLDRHAEEEMAEVFARAIAAAGAAFLDDPTEKPFTPSWSRVVSALPGVLARLNAAVEADRA